MNIEEYLKEWQESEVKECNNPEFIAAFIEYMKEDGRQYSFISGENGYFGYTARICGDYNPFGFAMFELAYSGAAEFVKVFSANHNGYWVPEYIDLKGDEALEILNILKSKLLEFGGF